jgi:hypothetical protein
MSEKTAASMDPALPKKGVVSIPSCLTDVTADWVSDLLYKVLDVPEPDDKDGTHNGITLLQVRVNWVAGLLNILSS